MVPPPYPSPYPYLTLISPPLSFSPPSAAARNPHRPALLPPIPSAQRHRCRLDPIATGPGRGHHRRGRHVRAVDAPIARRLRAAVVPHPVPADADRRATCHGELRRHGAAPPTRVLAAGVQGWHGEQGRRACERHLLRRQPRHIGPLREGVKHFQGHVERLLRRGVQGASPVRRARHALCHDDLLGEVVI